MNPPSPQQNKLSRIVLVGILYFILGVAACLGVLAFTIALLLN